MPFLVMYSPIGGEKSYEAVIQNGGGEVPGGKLFPLSGEARKSADAWSREDDEFKYVVVPVLAQTKRFMPEAS